MANGLTLTVLGTGTPYPRPGLACSGYLIAGPATTIWTDAGPGTFAELQRHLDLQQLDAIWISHMHPDHAGDLPAVANWLLNAPVRHTPLPIYGPAGWLGRLSAFLPSDPALLAERIQAHELADGCTTEVGELTLTGRAVRHSVPTFGLRVTFGRHVLAYSGDSGPCDALTELAYQADIFLCESGAAEYAPAEPGNHCTPEHAGSTAQQAGAKRLLLTHLSPSLDPRIARTRASAIHADTDLALPGGVHHVDDDYER